MPAEATTLKQPFITAYGDAPLVILTEFRDALVHARVVRPREFRAAASGGSWPEAHWALFNTLLGEYMNLERRRGQLNMELAEQLFLFDALKDDGTLALIASIARSGFPPEFTEGTTAPYAVSEQGS